MKVLLVDDSNTMRRIQKNQLAKLGITEIVEAENGQDALDKVKSESPELVLLDWNMPVMDGITCLRTLRQSDKKTKVIMCTSESEKEKVVEALKSGANDYMVKPFDPETLKEKLNM